ncbi:MAG TPA: hypothetical protein VHB54_06200 [Mucilaginibacter sp.]|nr:hypothetical protein [Mucilaginibacter sp.]
MSKKSGKVNIKGFESIPDNKVIENDLEPFKKTDERPATSREDLLDEFDALLANHQLDNKMTKRYLGRIRLPRLIGGVLGIAMCVLAVVLVLTPPAAHDNTARYVIAAGMLIAGAYIGVRFAL